MKISLGNSAVSKLYAAIAIVIIMVGLVGGVLYYTMSQGPSSGKTQTAKIGWLSPITGDFASEGIIFKISGEVFQTTINNQGGIKSLGGENITLIDGDTASDPATAAREAERLIVDDNVSVLLGCVTSSEAAAVQPVAEQYHVPFIATCATAISLTQGNYSYFFRTGGNDLYFSQLLFNFLEYVQTNYNVSLNRVALIHENSAFGNGAANLETQIANSSGFNIVANIAYDASSSDLSSQALQLKSVTPDVILETGEEPDCTLLVRTFNQLGVKAPLISGYGWAYPGVLELGNTSNYLTSRTPWCADINNSLSQQYVEEFQEVSNLPIPEYYARNIAGLLTAYYAMENAGSTDRAVLTTTLRSINVPQSTLPLPFGVQFDSHGDNTLASGVIVQNFNGTYYTVWPLNMASKELVFPMP